MDIPEHFLEELCEKDGNQIPTGHIRMKQSRCHIIDYALVPGEEFTIYLITHPSGKLYVILEKDSDINESTGRRFLYQQDRYYSRLDRENKPYKRVTQLREIGQHLNDQMSLFKSTGLSDHQANIADNLVVLFETMSELIDDVTDTTECLISGKQFMIRDMVLKEKLYRAYLYFGGINPIEFAKILTDQNLHHMTKERVKRKAPRSASSSNSEKRVRAQE